MGYSLFIYSGHALFSHGQVIVVTAFITNDRNVLMSIHVKSEQMVQDYLWCRGINKSSTSKIVYEVSGPYHAHRKVVWFAIAQSPVPLPIQAGHFRSLWNDGFCNVERFDRFLN